MGNLFPRAVSSDDERDRMVREVGDLFALTVLRPAPTPRPATSTSSSSMLMHRNTAARRSDDATASTKGSPDLSIRKGEAFSHQCISPSSASRRRTLSNDVTLLQRCRSPFSRMFRRKREEETSRLPSHVIVQPTKLLHQHQHLHEEDQRRPTPSNSIPVKSSSRTSLEEEQALQHQQQLYDLRTWDMYLRITEARKKNPPRTPRHIPQTHPTHQQAAGGWYADDQYCSHYPFPHNSHHPHASPSDASQELIFGDLEF